MTEPRPPIRPRDDDWPQTREVHREQADENALLRDALRVALEALVAVEDWWLVNGKHVFLGAPASMFLARAAIAAIKEALAAAQEDSRE